ncbi:hypothetical protein HPB48_008041 [Haemaphysalis longicornis]|uniref:Uncharacterized protein n=1 Tax=Haemaphysalis longicornis TaxID=44386 RepID=A0A9J6FYZ3_HAELO|nr:hypothetical protein HPB48_008041 [Haemaphysalis longicornis]
MWVTAVTYARTLTCASVPSFTSAIRATITMRSEMQIVWPRAPNGKQGVSKETQASSTPLTIAAASPPLPPSRAKPWSHVASLHPTPPTDFPPLPPLTQPDLDSQAMIAALREENVQLRQLLTAQTERTANLEKRLEVLSKTAPTPQTTPPAAAPSSANPTPPLNPFTSPDIARLESLIRDIGQALSERITALESHSDLPATPEPKCRIPRKHQAP